MAMDMRGTLNVSKFQKGNNQPRFYGRCVINGTTYNMKGWEKEGRDGPWISILFEPLATQDDFTSPELKKPSVFSQPGEVKPKGKMPDGYSPGYSDLLDEDDVPF